MCQEVIRAIKENKVEQRDRLLDLGRIGMLGRWKVREVFLEAVILEKRLTCSERGSHVDTGEECSRQRKRAAKALRADQSQLYPWIQFVKVTE